MTRLRSAHDRRSTPGRFPNLGPWNGRQQTIHREERNGSATAAKPIGVLNIAKGSGWDGQARSDTLLSREGVIPKMGTLNLAGSVPPTESAVAVLAEEEAWMR